MSLKHQLHHNCIVIASIDQQWTDNGLMKSSNGKVMIGKWKNSETAQTAHKGLTNGSNDNQRGANGAMMAQKAPQRGHKGAKGASKEQRMGKLCNYCAIVGQNGHKEE